MSIQLRVAPTSVSVSSALLQFILHSRLSFRSTLGQLITIEKGGDRPFDHSNQGRAGVLKFIFILVN